MEIGSKRFNLGVNEKINIYFLGDIHEGNCNSDEGALAEAVNIIKTDPAGYWIGMGDYIEAITHTGDKRFDPLSISKKYNINDLKDLPYRQAEAAYKKLKPIEDKCLALVAGNHEEKYSQYNSSNVYRRFIDMFQTSAHKDGKPPFTVGYVGFYNLNIKTYVNRTVVVGIALNHGVGGGGYLEGYKTNKLHQVFKYMHADINAMGHVHQLDANQKVIITCSSRDKIKRQKRFWLTSGCFLRSYVEGNTNYYEAKAGAGGESDVGMVRCGIWLKRTRTGGVDEIDFDGELEKIYL